MHRTSASTCRFKIKSFPARQPVLKLEFNSVQQLEFEPVLELDLTLSTAWNIELSIIELKHVIILHSICDRADSGAVGRFWEISRQRSVIIQGHRSNFWWLRWGLSFQQLERKVLLSTKRRHKRSQIQSEIVGEKRIRWWIVGVTTPKP